MLNPGDYSLADLAITAALTAQAQTPITDLEGMLACTVDIRFLGGSGGSTCKVYIQTTLDNGVTWVDIICRAFANTPDRKVINLSALTPVAAFSPTDGAMSDDTLKDGILGSALRAKVTTTGTYSNTTLTVKINAK